jgi:hypothetical protein
MMQQNRREKEGARRTLMQQGHLREIGRLKNGKSGFYGIF